MKKRYESKVAVFLILVRKVNGKIEILLQRRCNTGYMDGKYDMACSGHLEKGESLSMALVREAKEEIDLDIKEENLKLVSVIHPYKEDYINAFFITEKYEGTPKIMEHNKCDDLRWFDLDDLPENITIRNKNVIKNIQKGIIYDDGDFSLQKIIN